MTTRKTKQREKRGLRCTHAPSPIPTSENVKRGCALGALPAREENPIAQATGRKSEELKRRFKASQSDQKSDRERHSSNARDAKKAKPVSQGLPSPAVFLNSA